MPKIKLTKEEAQLVKDLQKDWDKVTKPYFANLKRFDQRESEREVEYTKLMNLLSARDRDAKQSELTFSYISIGTCYPTCTSSRDQHFEAQRLTSEQ